MTRTGWPNQEPSSRPPLHLYTRACSRDINAARRRGFAARFTARASQRRPRRVRSSAEEPSPVSDTLCIRMTSVSESRPRRLTRAEQQELTRERILEAADAVFAERGYRDATIEEIAARAG